jgi:hypothetical protein
MIRPYGRLRVAPDLNDASGQARHGARPPERSGARGPRERRRKGSGDEVPGSKLDVNRAHNGRAADQPSCDRMRHMNDMSRRLESRQG